MGPFDNETCKYLNIPEYEEGVWLSHEDGDLYIIPKGVADVEGPDDVYAELINALCRAYGDGEEVPTRLFNVAGLYVVPSVLKRFDEERGYYHA